MPVPRPNVQLEPYALASDEAPVHLGRLATSWLLAPGRMMGLRRIHADVADLLDALPQLHVDGVAVHDADHGALDRLTRRDRGQEKR